MTGRPRGPVVTGVDGSDIALRAVRWAAREAGARKVPLRLVLAFTHVADRVAGHPGPGPRLRDQLLDQARKSLRAAAIAARREVPDVVVEEHLRIGFPTSVLVDESRSAALVVVGEQGLGRVAAALTGSVAVSVAVHAECPVVVVRGEGTGSTEGLPVVVGVDGTPISEAALAFAFDAADRRRAPLIAVHTCPDAPIDPADPDDGFEAEKALLAERLAGWSEKYPGVPVRRVVTDVQPVRQLLELSRSAQLVVVGSRGHGDFVGWVLGSVSNAVVHRAACPVAVVRPEVTTEGVLR
ncbi:Nucleotide-binding universal stress protein, UspA family [Pseudonocardia thermophila]|uniref:Nucleotide-binding universal stress protein, UspA family n=1 Tax=Pseudonocardia thermophila TaxID=1848 RepID=A0A1M6V1C8_PSETH|nr:universal stress protein [Pseudonocardia thermophila]SHK75106.1 Nucleotide-binding universal stress protein, UspA family [Pseudonocardia thermophila]